MILSDECFEKPYCYKYVNKDKVAECRDETVYCQKLYRINELYKKTRIEKMHYKKIPLRCDSNGVDFDSFEKLKAIETKILQFVKQGENLYLFSKTSGNGKTSWAVRLLQGFIHSIWPTTDLDCKALFIHVPTFLLAIKNFSKKDDYVDYIMQNVKDVDLVIWDDIATKSSTEYEAENLLSILDYRFNAQKSNIFTSNLTRSELEDALGTRLASRIIGYSTCIELFGEHKRALRRGDNK